MFVCVFLRFLNESFFFTSLRFRNLIFLHYNISVVITLHRNCTVNFFNYKITKHVLDIESKLGVFLKHVSERTSL